MTYRGRFAPSPTGDLHLGSLVAAVGSWLRARWQGGEWIVRIEDIDPPREVAGSADRIIGTLARFGMESDQPVVFQSDRRERYSSAVATLIDRGFAYRCGCSRTDLSAFDGMHPAHCIRVARPGDAVAWRVRVGKGGIGFVDVHHGACHQWMDRDVGDFVVERNDGWPAYQLAVVVDDADQCISEVVRGTDLLDSTPRQMLLQRLLGLPTPRYLHLPVVVDATGRKLSKQDGDRPVDAADPLPALRTALLHLGIEPPAASAAQHLLAATLRSPSLGDSVIGAAAGGRFVAMQR